MNGWKEEIDLWWFRSCHLILWALSLQSFSLLNLRFTPYHPPFDFVDRESKYISLSRFCSVIRVVINLSHHNRFSYCPPATFEVFTSWHKLVPSCNWHQLGYGQLFSFCGCSFKYFWSHFFGSAKQLIHPVDESSLEMKGLKQVIAVMQMVYLADISALYWSTIERNLEV